MARKTHSPNRRTRGAARATAPKRQAGTARGSKSRGTRAKGKSHEKSGNRRSRHGPRASSTRKSEAMAATAGLTVTEVEELDTLRRELEAAAKGSSPLRWNADPDDVQRSVAQLVLTLVEFIRKLLERQAIRRMDAGTLTDAQTEDVGRALMQLERTIRDIAARFGLGPDDLNLDLGPVGRLM